MKGAIVRTFFGSFTFLVCILLSPGSVVAGNGVNYEEAPIHYSLTTPKDNVVAKLKNRLESGELQLHRDAKKNYLPSLLEELGIDAESQLLVFSKTSLQNDKIGPATPRAIFFNDQVHVGYVQDGVIEIAAADAKLGMAFYTIDPRSDDLPKIERQANRCMSCHGVARTRNVPGILVRSVFPDLSGAPIVSAGSHQTTHRSPLNQRWGGWYVTGNHGSQKHLGNFRLEEPKKPKNIDNEQGMNRETLEQYFDPSAYLRPSSDIVALMVLEHQTDGYNLLTQANLVSQHAIFNCEKLIAGGGDSVSEMQKMHDRIATVARPLVEYLFFAEEFEISQPISSVSGYRASFELRGLRESKGRSLRDFDLTRRLFQHPLSYLIYAPVFEGIPVMLQDELATQIESVLNNPNANTKIKLSDVDRENIKAILHEVPPAWFSDARARAQAQSTQ